MGYLETTQSVYKDAALTPDSGLDLLLQPGTLSLGTGALTYTVSGTVATSGSAYFDVDFGGENCVLEILINDSSSGGTAVVSAWDCSGTQTGTLYEGQTPLAVTKTAMANVTKPGTYSIRAESNGVLFSASGEFFAAGNNKEVVLYATGTPLLPGSTSFSLNTTPSCSFDFVVLNASSGGTAVVNSWDCSGTGTGSLTVDVGVSGVTQQVTANVATAGTYNFSATANGVTFTASGTFAGTGSQIVTLTATGTPTVMGTHSYALSTTPSCSFTRETLADPSSGGSAKVSSWNCLGADTGTLIKDQVVVGVTREVTAQVNQVGSYYVTAYSSGVTFTGMGTCAATGSQIITLTATGTPTVAGTLSYPLSTTPNCSFNRQVYDLVADCDSATVTGTLVKNAPLSGVEYSITITNNTTVTTNFTFNTSDLTLSGVGGLAVTTVTPAGSFSLAASTSQTFTYTLGGTPLASGTLTLDWSAYGLSCTTTATVLAGTASFTLPVVYEVDTATVTRVDNGTYQVVVDVPYTAGIGEYDAFTGTYVPAATTSDTNSMRISYPAGTFSAAGFISVTIEVDGDGSYVVAEPAGPEAGIVTLPFFYSGDTAAQGNIQLNAVISRGLPAGLSITSPDQRRFIASVYDEDYEPYITPVSPATTNVQAADGAPEATTMNIQGVLGTLGSGDEITLTLEINNPTLTPIAYDGISKTVSVPSNLIEGGGGPIDVTLSHAAGIAPAGTSELTVTIAAATTLNAKKLDMNAGLGNDYRGVLMADFSLGSDEGAKSTGVQVRIIAGGILDRKFGDGDMTLYTCL